MNDYFAGRLAHERQADFMREIARDELAAEARRARSGEAATEASEADLALPVQRRVSALLLRFGPARLVARGHRP